MYASTVISGTGNNGQATHWELHAAGNVLDCDSADGIYYCGEPATWTESDSNGNYLEYCGRHASALLRNMAGVELQ